jgi:hypothetical protein
LRLAEVLRFAQDDNSDGVILSASLGKNSAERCHPERSEGSRDGPTADDTWLRTGERQAQ